jgi:hypothetical protein
MVLIVWGVLTCVMQRRTYILALTAASTPLLAGCSGDSGGASDGDDGGDGGDDGSDGTESTNGNETDGTDTEGENTDEQDQATDGSDQDGTDESTSPAVAVVEQWYEIEQQATGSDDPTQYIEDAKALLHSKSPLVDLLEQAAEEGGGEAREITNLQTELTQNNLSADELNSTFFLTMDPLSVSEETVNEIAGENAIVEAKWDELEGEPFQWIVVKEDGEWVLFANIQVSSQGG